MDKKTEALKLALEALDDYLLGDENLPFKCAKAITAIREALAENTSKERVAETAKGAHEQPAKQECNHCGGTGDVSGEYPGVACPECSGSGVQAQPEFIKHEVENAYDWSEWVCPDPESYLMKCCDCGLVHEAQFRVAKYKPAPLDECQVVSDPDLQAQFRMRRSEQWSPADTAYRPGGLSMAEQPAQQQEPVGDVGLLEYKGNSVAYIHQKMKAYRNGIDAAWDAMRAKGFHPDGKTSLADMIAKYTSPPAGNPLTDEQMFEMAEIAWRHGWASCRDADYVGEEAEDERWGMVGAEVVQDIAAHGIKEKNT